MGGSHRQAGLVIDQNPAGLAGDKLKDGAQRLDGGGIVASHLRLGLVPFGVGRIEQLDRRINDEILGGIFHRHDQRMIELLPAEAIELRNDRGRGERGDAEHRRDGMAHRQLGHPRDPVARIGAVGRIKAMDGIGALGIAIGIAPQP